MIPAVFAHRKRKKTRDLLSFPNASSSQLSIQSDQRSASHASLNTASAAPAASDSRSRSASPSPARRTLAKSLPSKSTLSPSPHPSSSTSRPFTNPVLSLPATSSSTEDRPLSIVTDTTYMDDPLDPNGRMRAGSGSATTGTSFTSSIPISPQGISTYTASTTAASTSTAASGSVRAFGSSAAVVAPIIKIRPEYHTIFRKDPTGVRGKQNVVCVVSIELPSRRQRGPSDARPPPYSQSRLATSGAHTSSMYGSTAGPTPGRERTDSHSYEEDRSEVDSRGHPDSLSDQNSRHTPHSNTGTGTYAEGPAMGLPVPRSPSLHTRSNSASQDERYNPSNGGGPNPLGISGSETGFRSTFARSDEKLPGQRDTTISQHGTSPDDAGFSFGATPAAAGPASTDLVLQAAAEDLRLRVTDWKGHGPNGFGSLLAFGYLRVRQPSVIRDFHVFLFKEVLLCISEDKKKGLSRFIPGNTHSSPSGPATGAPVTKTTLATLSVNAQNAPHLKLKGRIYLRHIRKIACSPPKVENTINIKLDNDSLDQFVLTFPDREQMDHWAECILRQLSASALARSTVYGISINGIHAATEPGRPGSGLGIQMAETKQSFISSGMSDAGTFVSSASAARLSPGSRATRRADSLGKKPAPSPMLPSPLPTTPSTHFPMSPSLGSTSERRTRSRSPGPRMKGGNHNAERSSSASRMTPQPGTPITTVAADDAPYARWSSSGGYNPSLPAPPLLPHSPIDLVVVMAVPPPPPPTPPGSNSPLSAASLKLKVIRATLELVISSMGPRDRLAVVTFSVGVNARVRRTALLNSHKPRSVQKFQQFVHSLDHGWDQAEEDPFLEDIVRNTENGQESLEPVRIDQLVALNIGLDIALQRKSKNPITGLLLISDTNDVPKRQDLDLTLVRAEAANVPVHTFGFGKTHDSQILWQLSNQTKGLYTFVREWDQLQESLLGCIGTLMSVALIEFRVHLGLPSDNHFRVRKVSGPKGAFISPDGKDVEIDIGELRFGEVKEIFIELDFDFNGLVPFVVEPAEEGRHIVRPIAHANIEEGSATSDLIQRFGLHSLQDGTPQEVSSAAMIEDIAVLEVDASYRDTTSGRTPYRTPQATVLTLEIDAAAADPLSEASAGMAAVLADPSVTRRRIEILVSDMITRALSLAMRHNDPQALAVLSETRRIVETVIQALTTQDRSGPTSAQRRVRRPRELASMSTIDGFFAILEDLDLLLDALEHARHQFERDVRHYAAQQAMVLRDQTAWTTRSLLEYLHFTYDNGPALTAHGAILGRASIRK
ncbi:hypothetical protein OC861_000553 [Tilletia horrida]|nr:hypothetical protein OC845_003606 [Tilletia horrida]KAK0569842.1 hypothetical protein OC861_000553 [Tilletia horrida]